jgi:hypothetical protein
MTEDLVERIDGRLAELGGEIALLEAARKQLLNGHGAEPSSTKATRPARRRRRRAAAKTFDVVPAGRLEGLLAKHDGITSTALAQLADGRPNQVLTLLKELEQAGKARRSGQRRGTRWHVITDEDRIQARAAELEKQRRRPATRNR